MLILDEGDYAPSYTLQGNKTITIKAAEGAHVVFTKGPGFSEDHSDAGGLVMDDFTIYDSSPLATAGVDNAPLGDP